MASGTDNRTGEQEQVTDTDVLVARKKTENKRATTSVREYNRTKGSHDGMTLFYRRKEGAYVDVEVTCKGAIKYFLSVPDEDARHLKEATN